MKYVTNVKSVLNPVKKWFNRLILLSGYIFLSSILLSFTSIPYYAYHRLGTHGSELETDADYIVLLGGVGMPSPEDLIRCYYTAEAYQQAPAAMVIIAFPPDTSRKENSPEQMMARELIMRGVDSLAIAFEPFGYSTHTQSVNVLKMIGLKNADSVSIRLVTAPEHMYRAVKTFRKTGFRYVGGTPAFESAIGEDELIRGKKVKHEKRGLNFRYNVWSYLKYEIIVVREYCAIVYYKVKGWI